MKLGKTFVGALAALPLIAAASMHTGSAPAGATATGWNPGSFVPTVPTAARADNSIPVGVTFHAGKSGTFTVKRDISPPAGVSNPGWSFLHLDTDDVSNKTSVTVRIYRTSNSPFGGTCSRTLVATLTSSNGTGCHTDFVPVGHAWDFDNYVYWFELSASRQSADSLNITAHRVVLHV